MIEVDPFTFWLEQNIGLNPEVQAKLFSTLVTVLILAILYQLILRAIVNRIEELPARYRWRKTSGYLFFLVAVLLIGPVWFEGIQSIATYLGLLTAGLAIALRDVITDVLGWMYLLGRKPLQMGDRVQVGDHVGDVIDQGVFQFTLLEVGNWVGAEQSTGRLLYIPNSMVFRTAIANYTKGLPFIWNEIPVLLAFGSNWERAKELLAEIVNAHHAVSLDGVFEDRVRKISDRYLIQSGKLTPAVYTCVQENGILLTLRYLCEPRQRRDSAHAIWERILRTFAQYPDIHFVNQPRIVVSESENR